MVEAHAGVEHRHDDARVAGRVLPRGFDIDATTARRRTAHADTTGRPPGPPERPDNGRAGEVQRIVRRGEAVAAPVRHRIFDVALGERAAAPAVATSCRWRRPPACARRRRRRRATASPCAGRASAPRAALCSSAESACLRMSGESALYLTMTRATAEESEVCAPERAGISAASRMSSNALSRYGFCTFRFPVPVGTAVGRWPCQLSQSAANAIGSSQSASAPIAVPARVAIALPLAGPRQDGRQCTG